MGKLNKLIVILPVLIAWSLVYYPPFWVYTAMLIDFYTPWVLFDSKIYDAYHNFLVSRLTDKPEIPLPELTKEEATYERLYQASNGFTFPVVIRQLMGNTTAVQQWSDHDWWISRYGTEKLLCGTLGEITEGCTVEGFFKAWKEGHPFYISGASEIVEHHPELHEMVDNEAIRGLEPGKRTHTQIFMGLPEMGSDVHCAIGINLFRQVAGRKKWYFIPPHQTVYLKPAINVNGFSCHTQTKIGKGGDAPSAWFKKLVRYTVTLNPGDVLMNPPWFWHGIHNLGAPNELIIGVPTRYGRGGRLNDRVLPSFRTNWLFSANSFLNLFLRYGPAAFKPGFKPNLQADIEKNRVVRGAETKSFKTEDDDIQTFE